MPNARGLLCPVRVRLHALETAQVRLQWGTLEGTAIGACSVHTRHDDRDKIETLQEPLTLRRPQGNVGYDTSAIIPMEGTGVLLLRRLGTHSAGPLLSRRTSTPSRGCESPAHCSAGTAQSHPGTLTSSAVASPSCLSVFCGDSCVQQATLIPLYPSHPHVHIRIHVCVIASHNTLHYPGLGASILAKSFLTPAHRPPVSSAAPARIRHRPSIIPYAVCRNPKQCVPPHPSSHATASLMSCTPTSSSSQESTKCSPAITSSHFIAGFSKSLPEEAQCDLATEAIAALPHSWGG